MVAHFSSGVGRGVSGRVLAFPEQRTLGARVKRWVGGVGLVACGLWWLLLGALLLMPDPAPALDGLFTRAFLPLLLASLLLPVFFLVFLRSGLRGPADPFVPDMHLPPAPPPPGRSTRGRGPAYARGGRRHLRVVRDTAG